MIVCSPAITFTKSSNERASRNKLQTHTLFSSYIQNNSESNKVENIQPPLYQVADA